MPGVAQLVKDGVHWEVDSSLAARLDGLLRAAGQIIKESPAKRVTRHAFESRTFFIKRYRHEAFGLRPWKFLLKPSQARQEWRVAQRLEALGVPIVRHLALGERWRFGLRESILITEGFDGRPLDEVTRPDLAAVLGFVGRLHDRGVLQRDLHPGNLLLNERTGELRLVDLHGTSIQRVVTPSEREANLAFLRIFLPIPLPAAVVGLSQRLRRDYLAHRAGRCLKHNREFEPRRLGGLRWHVRRPMLSAEAESLLGDPDGFLAAGARLLKSGRSATIGRVHGLVLKRYNLRKWLNLIKDLFRPSKARRAYRQSYHLELAGILTARPIATADRRVLGLLWSSYLLMEEVSEARHLGQWQGDSRHGARVLAELLARLHNEGFSHRDLKETNLVFDASDHLFLIDMEGLAHLGSVPMARAALDLARLARAAAQLPRCSRAERFRFLRVYCRLRRVRPRQLRVP